MLDKLSRRILKYMLSAGDPSNTYYDFGHDLFRIGDAVSSDAETVRAAVGHLQRLGYLRFHGPAESPFSFLLDHNGLHWRELSRLSAADFWKRSILTPIFVALITSIVTLTVWPAILRWLGTL